MSYCRGPSQDDSVTEVGYVFFPQGFEDIFKDDGDPTKDQEGHVEADLGTAFKLGGNDTVAWQRGPKRAQEGNVFKLGMQDGKGTAA